MDLIDKIANALSKQQKMKTKLFLSLNEKNALKRKPFFRDHIETKETDGGVLLYLDLKDLRCIYLVKDDEEFVFFFSKEYFSFMKERYALDRHNASWNIQGDIVKLQFTSEDDVLNLFDDIVDDLMRCGFDKDYNATKEGEIIEYLIDTFLY